MNIEFTDEEVLELHNVVARATHMTGLLSDCECTGDTLCVADRVIRKVVDAYFAVRLGTPDEPVEMDRRPQPHILHAMRHLHINGKCVKNKTGVFCD